MEEIYLQHPIIPRSSSSSAIDLTGTPAGIASAPPSPSPSLDTSDRITRRRASWGRVEAGQDPLSGFGTHSFAANTSATPAVYTINDDPFDSPTDDVAPFSRDFSYSSIVNHYDDAQNDMYMSGQAGPSTASLIQAPGVQRDGGKDDDEMGLTSRSPPSERWSEYRANDPENVAGATPRLRRRTVRYSTTPSPLRKTGTAIKSVSQNIRRMSLRVVNLAGAGLETQMRLADDDPDEVKTEELPDLTQRLPLRGRTVCCLGPQSRVRLALYRMLVYPWTETVILLLIILNAIILTIQAAPSLTLPDANSTAPTIKGYFQTWEDYVLFVLFIVFTLEAFARICVSGFLFDPEIPASSLFTVFSSYPDANSTPAAGSSSAAVTQSSLSRNFSITQRLRNFNHNLSRPFALSSSHATLVHGNTLNGPEGDATALEKSKHPVQFSQSFALEPKPTFLSQINPFHSSIKSDYVLLPFQLSLKQAHDKTHRNIPYLRHSWCRIDFVAIVSFWISFILASTGVERGSKHIGIFRAMSVIRTARLLTVTSGTTTIMHSLKTARPLLTSVAYFVLFAMILFSIIGIQSFKGSLRRACYLNPTLGEDEIQIDNQFCGGYIDPDSLNVTNYIRLDGTPGMTNKGYICPIGQVCREQENPQNNVESFDTMYYAALQVIIVASANGWSPLMYSMIDSEFFVSCLFFIICVVILNFWLINLFVAVITNTFSAIRKETRTSAFGAGTTEQLADEQDDGWPTADGRQVPHKNIAKVIYEHSRYCWVFLALVSLVLQATRTVNVSEVHEMVMYYGELAITLIFDLEIILRILASLPDWRSFFKETQNNLDTFLAIGTSIIQIPVIHDSGVYPWMTILQLLRFYRVILEVPRMRPLLLTVFGNMYGLLNMTLFLILINYIAALVAVQLLRGDYTSDEAANFANLFNAFLNVYQVFSSENWTDILYGAVGAEDALGQTVVVVIFISAWMLFANFIVLQMFIAVINENFDVAEESKKGKQVTNYYATTRQTQSSAGWFKRLNPYRWVPANPVKVKVENLPSNLILPMQKSLVQDYSVPKPESPTTPTAGSRTAQGARHYATKSLKSLHQLYAGKAESNDVPLATLKPYAREEHVLDDEETERHLELLASLNPEATATEDDDALYERKARKADFIRNHPTYDKTFWFFPQDNALRKACQKLVVPANGERIFGQPHSPVAHTIFQTILFMIVLAGIVVEIIATPKFRRNYFIKNGLSRGAWFDMAEVAFGFALLVEFLIKVVADGFMFTPNAYVHSIWNIIDFFILAGLLVNVTTTLIFIGGLSRLTRSLKALRVLRFITLFDATRTSFRSLIISGASRILDAAVLAILYMIPYAVWGLNLFAGKMNTCNDSNASGLSDCINEYTTTVFGNAFGFVAPRVWDNPSPSTKFSFDDFKSSLLILFEIVSLEGWIDAMDVATSITGANEQPSTNASEYNALFFVIYNLLGGVIILTLFVSIIIGNFTSKTGTALLTKPQREWIDLKKLITRQRPSKRPKSRPTWGFRAWCYDRAVRKHGWWARVMLVLYIVHVLALMTQTFTNQNFADTFRNDFFLALTFIYLIDVAVRFLGLGWQSFRANGWNIFDIISAGGSFVTTIIVQFGSSGFITQQLQKLFLVSIAFKLVQRTNSLNKLFKTVMASLMAIVNLLTLWVVFFGFFAILYVEVFSLTKWGSAENRNQNYSSVANALVMLAFMSTGEGWNQYMHDYAVIYPRCTTASSSLSDSDCGSVGWAFTLFIAWNVLSMYIFVNLFTGVVVDNFSYVFQTSGGAKSITREQMRSFKKIWAEFADPKTGYLPRNHFAAFFSRLSGIFEVRIYPAEYSIRNLMKVSKATGEHYTREVEGIDLVKLSKALDGIDYADVRKRRAVYSRLLHEASVSHQGVGISFTGMLTLLAHHKLIVDHEALVLHDLVTRTRTNKLVTDLVNLDRVRSLLKTISYRRRFLAHMEQKRLSRFDSQEIPAIVVDTMPETPLLSSRDISSLGYGSAPGSPIPEQRFVPPDVLVGSSPGRGLQRSSRRVSDISMLGTDFSFKLTRDSYVLDDDPENSFSSPMQNPIWGDLMSEAVKEEENR
ncbi:Ion transport protein-domain-containing protein [Desarmillaria ectypa]|nr:Ion transport protein-domain-containing protein [Desarmillaria ectypa]